MELSIAQQAFGFLGAILFGAALGVLYTAVSALRTLFASGAATAAFCDLLFWIFATLMSLAFVFSANYGVPRAYLLAPVAAGAAALYYFAGRRLTRRCEKLHSKVAAKRARLRAAAAKRIERAKNAVGKRFLPLRLKISEKRKKVFKKRAKRCKIINNTGFVQKE